MLASKANLPDAFLKIKITLSRVQGSSSVA